jgi:hypothetical protein
MAIVYVLANVPTQPPRGSRFSLSVLPLKGSTFLGAHFNRPRMRPLLNRERETRTQIGMTVASVVMHRIAHIMVEHLDRNRNLGS